MLLPPAQPMVLVLLSQVSPAHPPQFGDDSPCKNQRMQTGLGVIVENMLPLFFMQADMWLLSLDCYSCDHSCMKDFNAKIHGCRDVFLAFAQYTGFIWVLESSGN